MQLLKYLILIIEYAVFIYLGLTTLYLFLFAAAGLFPSRRRKHNDHKIRKMAVLIPGYKEDSVIIETARESGNQGYPPAGYDVYIIADSFSPDTLEKLRKLPVTVVEVSFEVSSKAKALNRVMAGIPEDYAIAVILDADNHMAPDFLEQVNEAFGRGFIAVQGHRVAKNTNTAFAVLDAISEEVNNHIFRKGHRALGLSSALIGSGMAFDYRKYKELMKHVTANGEDKELEMMLLKEEIRVEFLHHAMVYDEKIQKAEVFAKQRRRWLSAQFLLFRRYFFTGLKLGLTRGNPDMFDKLFQMIIPPRVLHLGITTFIALIAAVQWIFSFTGWAFMFPPQWWILLWLVTFAAILISVPRKYYSSQTLRALKSLPGAFFIMFGLLFRLKGAEKSFIHTTHGTVEPDNKK